MLLLSNSQQREKIVKWVLPITGAAILFPNFFVFKLLAKEPFNMGITWLHILAAVCIWLGIEYFYVRD